MARKSKYYQQCGEDARKNDGIRKKQRREVLSKGVEEKIIVEDVKPLSILELVKASKIKKLMHGNKFPSKSCLLPFSCTHT